MPIYEYRCKKCRNDFEAIICRSDDLQSVKCPKCSNAEVERILSVFSSSCGSGSGKAPASGCAPRSGGFS